MTVRSVPPEGAADSDAVAAEQRFDPEPRSVRAARRLVATALQDGHYAGDVDMVLLLTSELVTNAVRHAGTPFDVAVVVDHQEVRVDVEDEDAAHLLVSHHRGGQIEAGGRGLHILDQVADAWGVKVNERSKSVWFTAS